MGLDKPVKVTEDVDTKDEETYTFLSDIQGSIERLLDSNKDDDNVYAYEPFGKLSMVSDDDADDRHTYTAREWSVQLQSPMV